MLMSSHNSVLYLSFKNITNVHLLMFEFFYLSRVPVKVLDLLSLESLNYGPAYTRPNFIVFKSL